MGHGKTELEYDFSSPDFQLICFQKTSKSFQAGRKGKERGMGRREVRQKRKQYRGSIPQLRWTEWGKKKATYSISSLRNFNYNHILLMLAVPPSFPEREFPAASTAC